MQWRWGIQSLDLSDWAIVPPWVLAIHRDASHNVQLIDRMVCLVVHDSSNRTHSGTPGAPFAESPVIPRLYKVHPPPVVWVLVEQPVSSFHIARENVIDVETIHDAGTVIHQIHYLPTILYSLKETHVVGSRHLILIWEGEKNIRIVPS